MFSSLSSSEVQNLLKLMRPRQWIKNGFVFAALVFSGQFLNLPAIGASLLAFILFCLASSAVYILNDIRDREQDRQHPTKSKTRPLAAGTITLPQAQKLLAVLYIILLATGFFVPRVITVIAVYVLLNMAYSFKLKHVPVLDIFIVASGFVLRVYAGTAALNTAPSGWMFVTTLCLALYLAAVKRRQELKFSSSESRQVLENYSLSLIDRYAEMSATGALVFYSLYVLSEQSELIMSIPVVLFGLFRYWYVVERLDGGESPTDVLLSDRPLLITVLIWVGLCAWLVHKSVIF